MAVGADFLTKIRRAVRRNTSADVDAELTDLVEECRLDLQRLGVTSAKATSESDSLVLGAVRSFARWKFGLSNEDAAANREDYLRQADELRRLRDYAYYTITFTVKDGETAKADAEVTFNGETKDTNSSGQAIFYYVSAGINQEYTVALTGYALVDSETDVTADSTVNVALTAG